MHSDVLDPAVLPLPDAALLAALAIPPATQPKVLDRLRQGDITWTDDAAGLVVHVPPSGSTRARSRSTPRAYRVTADTCTCRGFCVHGGCYHPWLWAVIHTQLHPPGFTVSGNAALTLEQPLLVAAVALMEQHAVGEITIWLGGETLVLEWTTAATTPAQLSFLGTGAGDGEATARGPVTALAALIASCPPSATTVTLQAVDGCLQWEITP
jgi:hypothetical protein